MAHKTPYVYTLRAIGIIHSPFTEPKGTPIQPTRADHAEGWIELEKQYQPALRDLDGFDRIWLLYVFHRAGEPKLEVVPFLDTVPRGLFATRAPRRPNPIGLSCVQLVGIEGNIVRIADVDMIDGTPLLDIKPYAPRMDHFPVERSGWLDHCAGKRNRADDRFEK